MSTKVTIIGGGPGGYTAAIRLAQLGADVTLIEKDTIGGTCLNRGCIPTKALVRSAEVYHTIKNASSFGINVNNIEIDFSKIMERKNEIVKKLCDGIMALIKGNKITYISGTASFIDKNTTEVLTTVANNTNTTNDTSTSTKTTVISDYTIIATGSSPSFPPIQGADLPGILTSDSILELEKLPESLTIIGGGIIGMEFASIFQTLDTKVTVIETLPNILGKVDSDIVKRIVPNFKKRGIDIHTDTTVRSITLNTSETPDNNSYTVTAEGKTSELIISSECVLISTGRKPYTTSLQLESLGITTNRNFISIDNNNKTNIDNIYAIGDVTGGWMLAHAAAHQGITVAHNIMNKLQPNTAHNTKSNNAIIPSCIFTFPEIACAGLTEADANSAQIPYKTSKFMFGANGKALCLGEGEGFVKVIASKETGQILGVHIMGPHASDLIHEAIVAIECSLTATQLSEIVHAHPTLSEALSEAVMGIDGLAIHSINNLR